MRTLAVFVLAVASPVILGVAGAGAGGYVGFPLVGVPSGPHCGYAVFPALFLGGVPGSLLGLWLGIGLGLALGTALLDLLVPWDAGSEAGYPDDAD